MFDYKQRSNLKDCIINDTTSHDWKDIFCKDKNGNIQDFFIDEDTAKKMTEDGIALGCFYSEESYENILKKTIGNYADSIINFIESKRPIKTITVEYTDNIGFVLENNQKRNTNRISFVLIKDKTNSTKYGFIISNFVPIDGAKYE